MALIELDYALRKDLDFDTYFKASTTVLAARKQSTEVALVQAKPLPASHACLRVIPKDISKVLPIFTQKWHAPSKPSALARKWTRTSISPVLLTA